jgi:predicted Fe-Mo cluster-binding NifX family protein/Pyruvate/2-oxoacid:ferredoxin oxidoreductase delta subunit
MRIAITATGPDLEAKVDPRFGRCPYFVIVETDDLSVEAIENPNLVLGGGAGVQSGQLMAGKGVKHVLTGNCGPNAYQTLAAAGIGVIIGCSGGVRDVVEQFKSGRLSSVAAPNVASHFGMGGAPAGAMGLAADASPTFGPGMGRGGGGGRGMGGGRGGGMGRGGGRGMGRGMASNPAMNLGPGTPGAPPPSATVARVDAEKCTGCGLCVEVCPVEAIHLEGDVAVVDPQTCTGCGTCVDECPNEAIALA